MLAIQSLECKLQSCLVQVSEDRGGRQVGAQTSNMQSRSDAVSGYLIQAKIMLRAVENLTTLVLASA